MGTSKRYAEHYTRQMDESIGRRIMASGPPWSLGDHELALQTLPLTRPPRPVPVRVWVRYPDGPLRVDAEAVAWTERAVAVRWPAGDEQHKAWVWASAVSENDEKAPRRP